MQHYGEEESQAEDVPTAIALLYIQRFTNPSMTTLMLPLNIRNHHLEAIIDTGKSYSLIQESLWDQIKQEGKTLQSSKGQTFSLANGHIQHALGKVSLQCVVHNQVYPFRVFVMRNHDLTFPLIIGLEFLSISGMKLDFAAASYVFPEEEESHYFIAPASFKLMDCLPLLDFT